MDNANSEQLRFLTSPPHGNGGDVVISIGVPTLGTPPPEITRTTITTATTTTSSTCNVDTNSRRRKQQSVLIYITVFYALFIPVNVACDVHEFGIDVRVFAFISTGFWMCLLYHNIKQTKLWAVLVCNIKVIDDGEEVISIGVPTGGASLPEITRTSTTADGTCNEETTCVLSTRITVFLCAVALNTGCLAYKLGTPDSRFFFYIWFCIFLVWSAVCFNDMFDDEEEVISIDVPTGGAPLPEITSISTTADGTCNEETTFVLLVRYTVFLCCINGILMNIVVIFTN